MKPDYGNSEVTIYHTPRLFLVALRQKCRVWVNWARGQLRWTKQLITAAVGTVSPRDAEACMGTRGDLLRLL